MKKYFIYILLGLLCPAVMAVYYVSGVGCLNAIGLEMAIGILSSGAALLALKEYGGTRKPTGHWLSALIPLIAIPFIPVAMITHSGFEAFLARGMAPFVTMEGFAIAQLVLGVLMFRGLIFERGTERLMMPPVGFVIMKTVLRIRSAFINPARILREIGLQQRQTMLDYGCGVGVFTMPAAQIVGDDGVVYALDIHPLCIRTVEKEIGKRGIANVKTILSDRETGLPNESVDVVLLYDVLQMITDRGRLMEELHRVLKPDGRLCATAEHLDVSEFLDVITKDNLFTLVDRKGPVFRFRK
ncbi:MAG: class I SAM-dependent methyltransferase [Chloroflexota bacterium]|nr:class I SAM-dependent methyltransferase [Chloroflexota bacterium]